MEYDLRCEQCGTEAICPARSTAVIIARSGMGFIFDGNKHNQMPEEIQCRKCGKIYGLDSAYVRKNL